MTYQGVLLSESIEGGRRAGTIELIFDKLKFAYPQGEMVWSLRDVSIDTGGTAKRSIVITNSHYPGFSIYTSDKKILKDPEMRSSIHRAEGLKTAKNQFRIQYAIILILTFVILSPFAAFFAFRTAIVKKIASKIPPQLEQKAGDQLFKGLSYNYKIITDSTLHETLVQHMQPLVKVVEDSSFKFSFYIINDTTVNAFALPGGKVVINSGLILKSDNWSEVQGVIAHEISHVTQRHHIRGVINRTGIFYALSWMVGDFSGILAQLASFGGTLESLMYSREYEFEADRKGFEYLSKAHLNTSGMISFFEKLEKMHPDNKQSAFYSMLSTHPATNERIANLKSEQSKIRTIGAPAEDIKVFKSELIKKLK